MRPRQDHKRAFTVVELLVVVAIIGILLGLLLPGVSAARKRGRKSEEMNRLRQIGIAWTIYANSNQDYCLPGFLQGDADGEVRTAQTDWRVMYRYPDKSPVPSELAQPWTWRLMPYLEYDHSIVHQHTGEQLLSPVAMTSAPGDDIALDPSYDEWYRRIAFEPGFGYNAYYIGGWWTREGVPEDFPARPRYANVSISAPGTPGERINVLSRSPSSIQNSSKIVLFCSSGIQPTGIVREQHDQVPGAHYVVPPFLATRGLWSSIGADVAIQVDSSLEDAGTPVPIGRYTGTVAIVHPDGHTSQEEPGVLDDQRRWIDRADKSSFKHTPN